MKRTGKIWGLAVLVILMMLGFTGKSWAAEVDNNWYVSDTILSDLRNIGSWHRLATNNGEFKWKFFDYGTHNYVSNDWRLINDKWYYFDSEGWMVTGWLLDKDDWYYLNEDGDMATDSWRMSGPCWYYLGSDGRMLRNCITPDGYRVDVYGAWITNTIKTWDLLYYPDIFGPTEWPMDVPEDDSYVRLGKNNEFKITKYYQFKDVQGNVYTLEYFNTTNAPHRVYIIDEVEGNGFSVVDWFESTIDWQPPADSDPDNYPYDEVKEKYYNTGITGTEEKLHIIPAESETKVLHILLEYTGKP